MRSNNNHQSSWRRTLTVLLGCLATTLLVACNEPSSENNTRAASNSANASNTGSAETGVIDLLFIGHGQREGSGYHLSHAYAPMLNQALGHEKIRMDYRESLAMLTEQDLADVDAIMMYANYNELTPEREAVLIDFVENGGAFIPVHSASACFECTDAYVKLVGARFESHGEGVFSTRIAKGQESHPILHGLTPFETWDETYVHADHNEQGRTVLMYREDEPWTWVREQDQGRVFYTAYGHDQRTWGQPEFHQLLINGILWAVGDDKRAANRALVASLPEAIYEDRGTIPNYRRVEPEPMYQLGLEAEDSKALSMTAKEFELQLFVSEPDIVNPVSFTWDERGRLFVVESVDYPNQVNDDGKGNDRISVCEDTNGDGRANGCKVFADGLNIPTAIVAVNGGFIVAQAPHFLFLKDTTGDDKADVKEIINSGWGVFDTHAGPNNLRYGHDNRIWGAVGYSATPEDTTQGEFQNGLYRMAVDGSQIEPVGQLSNNTWGIGISEDFEIFGSTANNAPAWHVPLWRSHVYDRFDAVPPRLSAKIDDFTQVFPATYNFLQVDAHGRYTAGSGFNLYTARAFPERYWNRSGFIGEPTAHLLGQFFLEPKGSTYTARNRGSIIASTDEWLSPVHAEVGPDGQLWVADWYNFIIQHNPIPTEESAGFNAEQGKGNAHINPLRDSHRGRIYRLVAKDAPASKALDLSDADSATLVQTLSNDNLFWRITAQRKLVQEQRQDALPALQAILQGEPNIDSIGLDVASIHAIWALHGLNAFSLSGEHQALVERALEHPSAATRKNAIMALMDNDTPQARAKVASFIQDEDARIRLWALLAISHQQPSAEVGETLLRHRVELPTDEWLAEVFVLAALNHKEHYWAALNRTDSQLEGSFLQGFGAIEKTPEYLLAKEFLSADNQDFTDTLKNWGKTPDGRLAPFSIAVLDAWRERGSEPAQSELNELQKLIEQLDDQAQMALKLRSPGLPLTFAKVDEAAYLNYHTEHAFQPDVWDWGPPEHGQPLYQQHCASCHSGDGSGDKALGAPALAGMSNWYAQTQLQKFFAGLRGTHFKDPDGISMRAALDFLQVEPEPSRQISFPGHYVETLPAALPQATVEGDLERGEQLYNTCVACHGAQAEGQRELDAPSLRHQADWYLLTQLQKFRSGARGADPRDARGQEMAIFAKTLADQQALNDVVAYIYSLSHKE